MSFARNCNTMRRNHIVSVRMDDIELKLLDEIAEAIGVSRSDAIRFCLMYMDLYIGRDIAFVDVLKPFPELVEYIGQKLKEKRGQSDLNRK